MSRLILALSLALLSACDVSHLQTSSGAAFAADRGRISDPAVAQAIQGEPDLQFPARIGVARIEDRQLTALPPNELIRFMATRPDPDPLGQFVPVSAFVAETLGRSRWGAQIRTAQLTAAKQHLDYVFIYRLTAQGWGFGKTGHGEAMLMDVRSGYVYGSTSTTTNIAGFAGFDRPNGAAAKVIDALAPDVAAMFNQLYARAQAS